MEKLGAHSVLAGILLGLVLGAGSINLALADSANAELVAFRGLDANLDRADYSRRAVRVRDEKTRKAAEVRDYTEKKDTSVEKEEVIAPECRAMQEVEQRVLALIPGGDVSYLNVERAVERAFEDAVRRCQQNAEQTKRSVQSVQKQTVRPQARVNNNCSKFAVDTPRYTKCVVNEREGRIYVGRQSKRYEQPL
jgi:hypothetical protein